MYYFHTSTYHSICLAPFDLSPVNSTLISHMEKLFASNNSSVSSIVIDKSIEGKSFRQNKSLSSYINDSILIDRRSKSLILKPCT